tara:strand:- start:1675 stop:2454 length:780 start_codon:yes stop_codon:yes gene_type:complete
MQHDDIRLPSLDIVIPVLNEEKALPLAVKNLHKFCQSRLWGFSWDIVIADNGSTDRTVELAQELQANFHRVRYFSLDQRGRGRALKKAWTESPADLRAYMDVDLSTDLMALPAALRASTQAEIVIGSRLLKNSIVEKRTLKREITSRGYSFLFRAMFGVSFKDAQCGFKVISRRAAEDLLPLVKDNGWFFDTELLILAEKNNYKVTELPVRWTDDPDTRVKILKTAWEDIRGLCRLRFRDLARSKQILKGSKKVMYTYE